MLCLKLLQKTTTTSVREPWTLEMPYRGMLFKHEINIFDADIICFQVVNCFLSPCMSIHFREHKYKHTVELDREQK